MQKPPAPYQAASKYSVLLLLYYCIQGTAVNVQAMAYGNMGMTSGTGVCFTRNPSTGERKLYGEYLINAQVCMIESLIEGSHKAVATAVKFKEHNFSLVLRKV